MHPIDRRRFLRHLGTATAAAWAAPDVLVRVSFAGAAVATGTTLDTAIVRRTGAGYQPMTEIPGWPAVLRELGTAKAQPGREGRRIAMASIVHLTDIHIVDAQSPARVEFLDRYADSPTQQIPFNAAQRPQETLTAQVSEAMVRRVNALKKGPQTGRAFDCAVSTGDNVDNQQENEVAWYIGVLKGGTVTPNSGDPAKYEGVQDEDSLTYDQHYWHPDNTDPNGDFYKKLHGFPAYPGLLAAAIKGFAAEGLKVPWYTTYGNHDGLLSGNGPTNPVLEAIATGPAKVVNLPAGISPGDFYNGLSTQDPTILAAYATGPARVVTADPKRAIASPADFVQAHLDAGGHGFTQQHKDQGVLYYTFTVAPGVRGISLDTVNRGGYADGSIGRTQFTWLTARLEDAKRDGVLVVLFSHHNLQTLGNPVPDPVGQPGADPQRVMGAEIETLLHRYANVILWVNGHSHVNRITARPDPAGTTQGFWEVSTAAHIDWPQHARIIEIADNRDGTISIFGTLIDHLAPVGTVVGATDLLGLAAISRELSANDPQQDQALALGTVSDRNVELLLAAPPVAALSSRVTGGSARSGEGGRGDALPATGRSAPLAVGAALVGGALALRRRGTAIDSESEQA